MTASIFWPPRSGGLQCRNTGDPDADPAAITLGDINAGPLTMSNGLTRLQTRFWGDEASLEAAGKRGGAPLEAEDAADLGLIWPSSDLLFLLVAALNEPLRTLRLAHLERAVVAPSGVPFVYDTDLLSGTSS
jgi:hypothetical protein